MEAFTLAAPGTIDGAIAAVQQPATKFIAGGTDLMQLMKDFVERPKQLVDIDGLPLGGIDIGPDGTRIGALARMSDVADHAELRTRHPMIAESLLASASPQVRNMATIGGNLLQRTRCGYFRDTGFTACNKRQPGSGCAAQHGFNRLHAVLGGSDACIATHPSDLAVALAALDARVELHGPGGVRQVKMTEFHLVPDNTPSRETVLTPGEIITAVLVPPPATGERSHYLKLRDRASFEFALVSAAVSVTMADGHIKQARIAMGGVGTKPWRMSQVETALAGAPADRATLDRAAALASDGAQPRHDNAFKLPLMRRALMRALRIVTA